jgi:hypothetical protein
MILEPLDVITVWLVVEEIPGILFELLVKKTV